MIKKIIIWIAIGITGSILREIETPNETCLSMLGISITAFSTFIIGIIIGKFIQEREEFPKIKTKNQP